MYIRQAEEKDVSRIAEILVYNNRVNFFPIFKDENYSFGELQVVSVANEYLQDRERLQNTFVYDNGLIRGFVQLSGPEIQKLYVDTFFQNQGIGASLINFAVEKSNVISYGLLRKIPVLSVSMKNTVFTGQKNGYWKKEPVNIW